MEIMAKEVSRNNQFVIYGRILRKEREEGYYIGSDITKKTGLSKQLISDIEIGNKNVSFDKIRRYASFFEIDFNNLINQRCAKEMTELFYDGVNCLIYADHETFLKNFMNVKKEETKIIHSKSADKFYLFEMINSLVTGEMVQFHASKNIIDKYFLDILDAQLAFIYWLAIGNYYNHMKEWEKALQVFKKISETGSSISMDLQSMLYYGLGYSYRMLGNPMSSMTAYQKAKNLFDESNNYIRSLYTSAFMGKNMVNLYRYSEAEMLYDNLMKTAQVLNDKKIIDMMLVSLTEIYFYRGDYKRAIELSHRHIQKKFHIVEMGVIKMWSCYMLKEFSVCEATVCELMRNIDRNNLVVSCMIESVNALLQQDDELIIEKLIKLYEITERDHLYDFQEFMLEILILALKRQKRYQEVVDYYECQIRILRRKIHDSEHLLIAVNSHEIL